MLNKKRFLSGTGLNPTEAIILLYLTITALYILTGVSELSHVTYHLAIRIFFTIIIFGIAYLNNKVFKNKIFTLLRNIYPLLFLGFFYKETGYMNNIIFNYFDPWFVKAEQFLWGMQPSLEFSKHFPQKWFSEIMNFGYFSYYLLTIGTALAVYYYKKEKTEETVFIIITSFLIYYFFFALFPVKGPQFYFPASEVKTVDSYFFSHLVKAVQNTGETQTGAFPSSHVGMSMVFLILTYKYARKIFWIILIPIVPLWFATVYIKAHYLIDTIIGFPSGLLVYWLSEKLYLKLKPLTL